MDIEQYLSCVLFLSCCPCLVSYLVSCFVLCCCALCTCFVLLCFVIFLVLVFDPLPLHCHCWCGQCHRHCCHCCHCCCAGACYGNHRKPHTGPKKAMQKSFPGLLQYPPFWQAPNCCFFCSCMWIENHCTWRCSTNINITSFKKHI